MEKIEPRTLKGFPDYSPADQLARQAVFAKIQSVFERFGFLPLSTPAIEYKEILMGKYGDDEKLIYSFKDNGDRDVALRYDLTVPLARYVAQNQGKLVYPFKRYQIAPVWRAENTQKGRLREFYQCDIDVVGTESFLADAEVMACICKAIEEIGVKDYELRINDRSVLSGFGAGTIRAIDKFDKIGVEGVVKELEAAGVEATEIEEVKKLLEPGGRPQAPQKIEQLIQILLEQGLAEANVLFDPTIARGLDYYTSTVFEIKIKSKPEFGSIAGGGRYDNLVDQFSDKPLPAVGGSIGIDRLLQAMSEMGLAQAAAAVQVLVINQDAALEKDYVALAAVLRSGGISTELYYEPAKLEKQFKYAENKGISYAVIMGQAEKDKGTVQVKNLATRQQKEIQRGYVVSSIS